MRCRLIDGDGDAVLEERDGEREAGDAAADNGHIEGLLRRHGGSRGAYEFEFEFECMCVCVCN